MVRPQRRVAAGFATGFATFAFLAACTPGSGPVAMVVHGSLVDVGGTPIAGAAVQARPDLNPRDIETSRLSELDSLALACVDERPPPTCGDRRRDDVTDPAGAFAVELHAGDLTGGPGVVSAPEALNIVAQREREPSELSPPAVSRRLAVASSETTLEPLTLWDPGLEMTTDAGGDATLRWAGDPPEKVSIYRVLVEASNGRLVWSEETQARELILRHAELQGTRGAVSIVAIGADEPQYWRSARAPYRADVGVVRLAGVDEVGWPFPRSLSQGVVLVAIVALLLASSLLVVTGGIRHRRQLVRGPSVWAGRR